MDKLPQVKLDKIQGITFIEQIMKPHTPYYRAVKGLFETDCLHGMAHITGGGIEGNLCRIIPDGLSAAIRGENIRILPVFSYIKAQGRISDEEMRRTFNLGVGFVLVVPQNQKDRVIESVSAFYDCYEIGRIERGSKKTEISGRLNWI